MITNAKLNSFYAMLAVPINDSQATAEEESARKLVAVVDDESDTCRLLKKMIESNPQYRVFTCPNALVALPMIVVRQPDLIVLDLNMPWMSGYEVLNRLKSNPKTCHIPVIILTAEDEDSAMLHTIRSYADAFIRKPCSRDEIISAVNRSLVAKKGG